MAVDTSVPIRGRSSHPSGRRTAKRRALDGPPFSCPSFDHLFEIIASAYTPRPVVARPSAPPRTPPRPAVDLDSLGAFSPAVRDWFGATFAEPTRAQVEGWAAIAAGHHTLIHAPTGSGKTLAAFLWCLDRLVARPDPAGDRASSPATSGSSTSARSRR